MAEHESRNDHHDSPSVRGVATKDRPQRKPPPMYRVVLLNDDHTPQAFVVELLERLFKMAREKAIRVMLTVHTQGSAVCGIFPREVAETIVAKVRKQARDHRHPLRCYMKPDGEA